MCARKTRNGFKLMETVYVSVYSITTSLTQCQAIVSDNFTCKSSTLPLNHHLSLSLAHFLSYSFTEVLSTFKFRQFWHKQWVSQSVTCLLAHTLFFYLHLLHACCWNMCISYEIHATSFCLVLYLSVCPPVRPFVRSFVYFSVVSYSLCIF